MSRRRPRCLRAKRGRGHPPTPRSNPEHSQTQGADRRWTPTRPRRPIPMPDSRKPRASRLLGCHPQRGSKVLPPCLPKADRSHPNRASLPKGRHPCLAKARRRRCRGLRWPSTTCLRSASRPAQPRDQAPVTKVPSGQDWRGRDRTGKQSRHPGPFLQAIGLQMPSRSGHPQERRRV